MLKKGSVEREKSFKLGAIAVIVLMGFAGCTGEESQESTKQQKNIEVTSIPQSKQEEKETETQIPSEIPTEAPTQKPVQQEAKEIWKDKYCKIFYKGLEEYYGDADIKLYIENVGKNDITIQVESLTINDLTIDPICSININHGKKANNKITISSSELSNNDLTIDQFKDIEVQFRILNPSSYK